MKALFLWRKLCYTFQAEYLWKTGRSVWQTEKEELHPVENLSEKEKKAAEIDVPLEIVIRRIMILMRNMMITMTIMKMILMRTMTTMMRTMKMRTSKKNLKAWKEESPKGREQILLQLPAVPTGEEVLPERRIGSRWAAGTAEEAIEIRLRKGQGKTEGKERKRSLFFRSWAFFYCLYFSAFSFGVLYLPILALNIGRWLFSVWIPETATRRPVHFPM